MIKRKSEMNKTLKTNMRDGDGSVLVTDVLNKDEYKGKSRLVATLTIEPGCSIGTHVHENEEEIFYIISGTAAYNDNGKEEILYDGDSCLCLSGEKHSIANRHDDNLIVFAVILPY